MTYRVVARKTPTLPRASPPAAEALQAVRQLGGDGFRLTATVDDAVPVETFEELASGENASH